MRNKRCDNAKSKSIYNISHRHLLSVESSKNQKKIKIKIKKIYERKINKFIYKLTILNYC